MITSNPLRMRKTHSLMAAKEDKENCNNNIQIQGQQPHTKMAKFRESLSQCNQPEKITNSLKIQIKDESEGHAGHLKREYSKFVKREYSTEIMESLIKRSEDASDALKNHMITNHLRAKMVDWMIEVLSSYKMSEECFFRSVKYMDHFFKRTNKKLQVSDLHLVGVTSMFMASKYQEIYPFKLNTMYQKICRKKFQKTEIIDMEQQVISVLHFQLQKTTCLDIIKHALAQLHISLHSKAEEYLNKVSIYLGKMAMHCSQIAWKEDKLIAGAVIYIGLKTVQQVETSLYSDSLLQDIALLTQIKVSELLQISQQLLTLAKSFHKQYPNLLNLKKFNNAQFVD